MRRFAVNLEPQIFLLTGGNSVDFVHSIGARGKVVINGINQGGIDVA